MLFPCIRLFIASKIRLTDRSPAQNTGQFLKQSKKPTYNSLKFDFSFFSLCLITITKRFTTFKNS
jgi:hypothetical protein